MISEHIQKDRWVPLIPTEEDSITPNLAAKLLDLVDGQQRTLAILAGWVEQQSYKVWVDFGDEPQSGHLLRLRVTTINQPYGFRRDDPNAKLSINDRRCAKAAYENIAAKNYSPHPSGARISLPIDLTRLIKIWDGNRSIWKDAIYHYIENARVPYCGENEEATLKYFWPETSKEQRKQIEQRINSLASGIERLFEAKIPLIRIDPELYNVDSANDVEPPLARLFKRIGTNATPLSNADYVYSVLKYIVKDMDIHQTVAFLHRQGNIASLMAATDLVMTALRLAATGWHGEIDRDNPSMVDFHRMLWPKNGTDNSSAKERLPSLVTLLGAPGNRSLTQYFAILQKNLEYSDEEWRFGVPKFMFPYFGRPLVQTLLYLVQVGYLKNPIDPESRSEALRLALWWTQWVVDGPKASRIAFQVIKVVDEPICLGRKIAEAIVNEGAGMAIRSPDRIQNAGLDMIPDSGQIKRLIGDSRFNTLPEDKEDLVQIRRFYRHWWRPWSYIHPMLLWLQREYVNGLEGNPMAGRDDDTPYDFDHILPRAHWGGRTTTDDNGLLSDLVEPHWAWFIGNSIGNVRVTHFSDNRCDGDASPKIKMGASQNARNGWLKDSAVSENQLQLWYDCSPTDEDNKKHWDRDRALAFQRVVERRTFDLYLRLYNDAGFAAWV